METVLKTAPTAKPVTLEDLKLQARNPVDETAHDDYLAGLIDVIIEDVEDYTWRRLITQNSKFQLTKFIKE